MYVCSCCALGPADGRTQERASTEASNLRLQVMQLKEELDEAKRAAAAAHTELGQLKSASRAASLSSLGSADTATRIAKLETELSAERADLVRGLVWPCLC